MYMREQVVRQWQQGKKPAQIMRELVEEDIVTTRHVLRVGSSAGRSALDRQTTAGKGGLQ